VTGEWERRQSRKYLYTQDTGSTHVQETPPPKLIVSRVSPHVPKKKKKLQYLTFHPQLHILLVPTIATGLFTTVTQNG
jgi:hypothetical protein